MNTIIYLEDTRAVRECFAKVFNMWGFEVIAVSNLSDAFSELEANSDKLQGVISDWNLQDSTSLDFVNRAQELGLTVVVHTGSAELAIQELPDEVLVVSKGTSKSSDELKAALNDMKI